MKRQGTLVRWEAARGFGFIRCPEVSADIFVHLRDFTDRQAAPKVGMALAFDEIHVGSKGPRAMAVHAVGATAGRPVARAPASPPVRVAHRRREASPSSALPGALLIAGYGALLGYGVWAGRVPPIAIGVLLLLSLLTFFVYGFDKNAAQAGRWRTRESTLHLMSLIGGWPGAWCAQRLFHHKNRKGSFMAVYWATVIANVAAVAAWVAKWVPAAWPAP